VWCRRFAAGGKAHMRTSRLERSAAINERPDAAQPMPSAEDRFPAPTTRPLGQSCRSAKGRLTRSPSRRRMPGICALRTAGVDVLRSLIGQGRGSSGCRRFRAPAFSACSFGTVKDKVRGQQMQASPRIVGAHGRRCRNTVATIAANRRERRASEREPAPGTLTASEADRAGKALGAADRPDGLPPRCRRALKQKKQQATLI
jgi:hypothetical protein